MDLSLMSLSLLSLGVWDSPNYLQNCLPSYVYTNVPPRGDGASVHWNTGKRYSFNNQMSLLVPINLTAKEYERCFHQEKKTQLLQAFFHPENLVLDWPLASSCQSYS